ncbi:MAG: vitamin K epoxide reductase family protein [Verrucomicrobiota bacterium]
MISNRILWVTRALLVVAAAMAGVLLWIAHGGTVAGCGPKSSCEDVLLSRWSEWQGIPVSAIALAAYLGLLAATFGLSGEPAARRTRISWAAAGFFSIAILLTAGWFVLLQVLLLKRVCPFCMGAHVSGGLAAAILLWKGPYVQAMLGQEGISLPGFVWGVVKHPPVLLGLVAAVVLMAGQRQPKDPGYKTGPLPWAEDIEADAAGRRTFSFHYKRYHSRPGEDPLLGEENAPLLAALFFDFTCPQCRLMHHHLEEIRWKVGHRMAVICLPVPLDRNCNPMVEKTQREHVNACELARLGLAVWRAAPEKYPEFDRWMFNSPKPPPLEEARTYAGQLAGAEALAKALADGTIDKQIARNVAIYRETVKRTKMDELPQMFVGGDVVVGAPAHASELVAYFEQLIRNVEAQQ